MNFERNTLINGTNIIVDNLSPYDIFIGITEKGFDYDYENNITGLSHLFEHTIFRHRGENDNILYNGSTCFNYITFFNKRKNNSITFENVCKNLIYKFYNEYNNSPFIYEFDFNNKLHKIVNELENEYYFRKSYDMDGISLFMVNYGKKYLGGTLTDLNDEKVLKKKLIELWESIDPSDIIIILKAKNKNVIDLINKTFGSKIKVKRKTKKQGKISPFVKTLSGYTCLLTKCENDFNINIKIDNDNDDILKGLFLLTTLGIRVNCINDNFYISLSFDRNPINIVNYLINEDEKMLIKNILENNDKRIYIEDIFHFYKYIDIVSLLEDYLYDENYIEEYSKFLYPVVRNIKKNILIFGNLIVNTPPDNILVNVLDTNNDKLFITEIMLDIECQNKEKLNIKRRKDTKKKERSKTSESVIYRKIYLENYDFKFNKVLNNYCYLILFKICNSANIKIDNNIKIIGDKHDIKDAVNSIKTQYMTNYYIYKDFCPYFYEILFQFYFFDDMCPELSQIIKYFRSYDFFRYDHNKIDINVKKKKPFHDCLSNKLTFNIYTEYNFIVTLTWVENNILYDYLLNYLKDYGLIYSMNMYESEDFVLFFCLTTNPNLCLSELENFISSYGDIDVLYLISHRSKKTDLDGLLFRS